MILKQLWVLHRIDVGPSLSIGLCLPASCSTAHLELIVNNILREKSSTLMLKIPKNTCQFEENATDVRTLDCIAM